MIWEAAWLLLSAQHAHSLRIAILLTRVVAKHGCRSVTLAFTTCIHGSRGMISCTGLGRSMATVLLL